MEGLKNRLDSVLESGLYRRLRSMGGPSAPRVQVDGRELVMCAANNYLGLANHTRLQEAAIAAIRMYGTGASGSRLITGTTELHLQLESAIAQLKQTEAAIVFNTGYMANLAVLSTIVGHGDTIFSDELNHASIIDGCRLSKARVVVYHHNDMSDLNRKIKENPTTGQRLIVTDGVFSMDGDIVNLPAVVEIAREHGAWVMVDDAHATGVFGEHGGGTSDYFGLPAEIVDIQVGTLSKAIAAEGGFVAGSHLLVDYLRNFARQFIFSTALSPAVIGSALCAIHIIKDGHEARKHLFELSSMLRRRLVDAGFEVLAGDGPIVPLLIGDPQQTLQFSQRLEEHGVFATAIRPPTVPPGTSRIRFTLMATHTDKDVEQVLDACITVGRELGVIS